MKCGLLLIFLALFGFVVTQNELRIAGFYPLTGDLAEFGSSSESATRFSVETLNAGYLADRNLTINFQGFDTSSDPGQGLQSLNSARESFNMFGVLGSQDDLTSSTIALSSTLFFYPQISYGSRGNFLTSSSDFPFFARVIPSFESEGTGLAALLNIYGWKNVGVIFTADDYGILTSERFINDLNDDITVTSVQFTPGETSLAPQMTVLRESLTRVNVMLPSSIEDARTILRESYKYEIVGDQFIWFGGSFAASSEIYVDNDKEDDTNYFLKGIAAGMISLRLRGGTGKAYEDFLDRWELLSPQLYSGSGNRDIPLVSTYAYDSVELFTRTFVEGEFSTLEEFLVEMRKISFVGITGRVQLDERNSRFGIFDIVNLRLTKEGDEGWVRIGSFYEENFLTRGDAHGVEMKSKPVFHDGSRDIPDVEVRPKIKYWDCDERRFNTNVDGKIKLDAPGPNAKRLASHYECDAFIDCFNISDESSECTSSNYVILFILTGVLTGVLILLACCLIPFVCVFGFCIKRVRVRSGSPPFLLIILISIILGYISIFAWYGQPHPVACAFQPWLLGLSISSLVAALCAKNIRIWRIFRSPLKRKTISDKEVLLTWVLMFAPSVFIVFLWTLISTPTATLKKLDGYHHYVCETGGFTGPPGGFIFFSIFVFYMAILLLAGGIVSFLTRKVPSLFNESRLIAISIYNLVGLSIIIIPVFFVLQNFNPLIGWVIRTIAILYALTATLLLLFGPKVWGMLFDLKKDNTAGAVLQSSGSSPSQTNNSTGTNSLSSHV